MGFWGKPKLFSGGHRDQIGGPTYNWDAARAMSELVLARAKGTFHVSNSGKCSRYEFAREILSAAGLDSSMVQAETSEKQTRPAPRPKYSALSLASLHPLGIRMRPWQEALRDYVSERNQKLMVAGEPA